MTIPIKNPDEQNKMRIAGRLAADALDMIEEFVQPGISTAELDRICHDFITNEQGAIPAPLNYRGFPKSICTSLLSPSWLTESKMYSKPAHPPPVIPRRIFFQPSLDCL